MADGIKRAQNTFKFVYFDGNHESTEGAGNGTGKKKKKPRPITSCQSCRRRKIKCINALLPCEACVESGDRCSLLDPPSDPSYAPPQPPVASSSSNGRPRPKPPSPSPSSNSGSSHRSGDPSPHPPASATLSAPPPPSNAAQSNQQSLYYQQNQYPHQPQPPSSSSYSPSSLASQPLKRPTASTSATLSSRSPPPSFRPPSQPAYHQIRQFPGEPSSSTHKRPRYSLPNPLPSYPSQAPQPNPAQPGADRPFAPSSRSTQPPVKASPQNSLAFLLHPWSPANDEFGPGRIRGEKVEPLPPGVGVGVGLSNGPIKALHQPSSNMQAGPSHGSVPGESMFKVPALPASSRPSAPATANSYSSSSAAHSLLAPNLHFSLPPPSAVSSPVLQGPSPARPLQPSAKSGTTSAISTSHALSTSDSVPSSSSTSRASLSLAASSDGLSPKTGGEERRSFVDSLGFMFPWVGEDVKKGGPAVGWAVESWGSRMRQTGDGDERSRSLLSRAKGSPLMGDLGVEGLETVLMVAWVEFGLSGPKTSWLYCSFAARIVESIMVENSTPSANGSSPSSSTPTSSSSTSNSNSHTDSSPHSDTLANHPPPSILPPHLHLSLFHLSTLLSLALPTHSHIHVPSPPNPTLPLPPAPSPPNTSPATHLSPQPNPPVLTLALHAAWASVLDLLSQIAPLLRGRGGRAKAKEVMQLAVELYGHLGERGGVLEKSAGAAAGGAGGEGRLALEVWMLGVFVLLNTPSLLPARLKPRTSTDTEPETPAPPVEEGDEEGSAVEERGDDVALSSATKLPTLLSLSPLSLTQLAHTLPFLATPVRWALHVLEQPAPSSSASAAENGTSSSKDKSGGMIQGILEGEREGLRATLREFLEAC